MESRKTSERRVNAIIKDYLSSSSALHQLDYPMRNFSYFRNNFSVAFLCTKKFNKDYERNRIKRDFCDLTNAAPLKFVTLVLDDPENLRAWTANFPNLKFRWRYRRIIAI